MGVYLAVSKINTTPISLLSENNPVDDIFILGLSAEALKALSSDKEIMVRFRYLPAVSLWHCNTHLICNRSFFRLCWKTRRCKIWCQPWWVEVQIWWRNISVILMLCFFYKSFPLHWTGWILNNSDDFVCIEPFPYFQRKWSITPVRK